MKEETKIRTRRIGDRTEILALVKHQNQSPIREGNWTRDRFIEQMTFSLNGQTVALAELGPDVAENPLMGVSVTGAKVGDNVTVSWKDNHGGSGIAETKVR